MADFKDEISVTLAGHLARELTTAWPEFPQRRFPRRLGEALAPLALLARVDLIADRLAGALPDDFDTAAKVLWGAHDSATFTGWMTLPCGTYVARAGIDHPDIALPLLAGLTPRWSSEGPIRPFIERHRRVPEHRGLGALGRPRRHDHHRPRTPVAGPRPRPRPNHDPRTPTVPDIRKLGIRASMRAAVTRRSTTATSARAWFGSARPASMRARRDRSGSSFMVGLHEWPNDTGSMRTVSRYRSRSSRRARMTRPMGSPASMPA